MNTILHFSREFCGNFEGICLNIDICSCAKSSCVVCAVVCVCNSDYGCVFCPSRLVRCQIILVARLRQKWTEQGEQPSLVWVCVCACTPVLACVCEEEIKTVPETCLWNSFGSLCSPVLNWKLSDLYPHISSQVHLQGDERLLSPSVFSLLLVFLQPGSTSADYFQYDSMNAVNWQIKGEPGLHLHLH